MADHQQYWNGVGKYQSLYDTFWERYVPLAGEADSPRGELLRNVGRIYHEYYNNGLCNSMRDEVYYLYDRQMRFKSYLKDKSRAPSFLRDLKNYEDETMEETYRDSFFLIDDKEFEAALDELVDAILLYVQNDERDEASRIPKELRLTDTRDWIRNFKEEDGLDKKLA